MLYSVPELKRIDDIPHADDYRRWRGELDQVDPVAYRRITAELNTRFDNREVDTSSWIPGADWRNTPFQTLYEACHQDQTAAALFFGLIVWQVVLDRDDCWSFGRYEKGGIPIRGMTYFRIDCP